MPSPASGVDVHVHAFDAAAAVAQAEVVLAERGNLFAWLLVADFAPSPLEEDLALPAVWAIRQGGARNASLASINPPEQNKFKI